MTTTSPPVGPRTIRDTDDFTRVKGSRYVDLSFEHQSTGEVVRVHTVTPGDASEMAKELAIRRRRPEDILIVLPKL
jgi:hypothetical protein